MWNALRGDLSEFYSSLQDETIARVRLPKSQLKDDMKEFYSDIISNTVQKTSRLCEDLDERLFTIFPGTVENWNHRDAVMEADRRRDSEEVYTTPLVDVNVHDYNKDKVRKDPVYALEIEQTREFLNTFLIEDKTEEICKLIKDHPETVKKYMHELVPSYVSYEEFWKRYFFRCDVERIKQFWSFSDRQIESTRESRKKMLREVKSSFQKQVKIHSNRTSSLLLTPIATIFSWERTKAIVEAECRMCRETIYTAPLMGTKKWLSDRNIDAIQKCLLSDEQLFEFEETERFLLSFDIRYMTEQISNVLEENPDSVGLYFTQLVPSHVSYEEFWQRFFFRCDEHRILKAWRIKNEEIKSKRMIHWTKILREPGNPIRENVTLIAQRLDETHQELRHSLSGLKQMKEQLRSNRNSLDSSIQEVVRLRHEVAMAKKRLIQSEQRMDNLKSQYGTTAEEVAKVGTVVDESTTERIEESYNMETSWGSSDSTSWGISSFSGNDHSLKVHDCKEKFEPPVRDVEYKNKSFDWGEQEEDMQDILLD